MFVLLTFIKFWPSNDNISTGEKGKRSGLTHSRVMIHQPLGGAQGQAM